MFIFTPNCDIDSVSYNSFAFGIELQEVTENYEVLWTVVAPVLMKTNPGLLLNHQQYNTFMTAQVSLVFMFHVSFRTRL